MSPVDAAAAVGAHASAPDVRIAAPQAFQTENAGANFLDALSEAAAHLNARVSHADEMVRAFVVDSSIPVHEVTIALEEARIAVELALEVRTRVIESYREIMNMQL